MGARYDTSRRSAAVSDGSQEVERSVLGTQVTEQRKVRPEHATSHGSRDCRRQLTPVDNRAVYAYPHGRKTPIIPFREGTARHRSRGHALAAMTST
ncbi:hypothetical protein Trydic_g7172 [Trypoxylus dichotomus]